jgi:hypothetical protein
MLIGYWMDDRELRVRFPVKARTFSLFRRFYAGFRTHQNLFSMGCRKSFAEIKQPKREADQSPSCSAEGKKASRYICPSKNLGVGIAVG